MKILSYEEREDGYVVIRTNDNTLSEVAYPSDKFKTADALEKEIAKKLLEISSKKATKDAQKAALFADLEKKKNA